MEKIILEGTEVFAQVQELILQPQSEIGAFRRFWESRAIVLKMKIW